jgi:hypothetical protein
VIWLMTLIINTSSCSSQQTALTLQEPAPLIWLSLVNSPRPLCEATNKIVILYIFMF